MTSKYPICKSLWKEFLERREYSISFIYSVIDQESASDATITAEFDWESYHTLDEIYAWLDQLLLDYPTILSPVTVGYTYEGREIRAVKLSHKTVIDLQI